MEKNPDIPICEMDTVIGRPGGKALLILIFRRLCGVILTDRCSEFRNTYSIEHGANGKLRTKVFYRDPYCSWQKGRVEKNHEFIRQVCIDSGARMAVKCPRY